MCSCIEGANGPSLTPITMIADINDDTTLETTIDNLVIFHSDNDILIQIANDTVMNVNEHANNVDQCSSTSSED